MPGAGCAGRCSCSCVPGRLGVPAVAAAGGDGRAVVGVVVLARRALPPPAAGVLVRRADDHGRARPRLRRCRPGTPRARSACPRQAVKTVLFPDQLGEAEAELGPLPARSRRSTSGSRSGRARSRARLRPASSSSRSPLPDISFFEFWEYIPHNSVLWIWIKMGFFGFVAMLFLFARAVQLGRSVGDRGAHARAGRRSCVTGVAYVVMFLVFAYVDIAWDARSTVFLGVRLRPVRRLRGGARRTRASVREGVHTAPARDGRPMTGAIARRLARGGGSSPWRVRRVQQLGRRRAAPATRPPATTSAVGTACRTRAPAGDDDERRPRRRRRRRRRSPSTPPRRVLRSAR